MYKLTYVTLFFCFNVYTIRKIQVASLHAELRCNDSHFNGNRLA